MGRLADALNNFNKEPQGATKRVYCQELIAGGRIAERINELQEEVGAVITIDNIEREVPTSANNPMRSVVYHYDK